MTSKVVFDIEADGLLDTITKIYCLVCYDLQKKEFKVFKDSNLASAYDYLDSFDTLIGHNIIGYDIPAIRKITQKHGMFKNKKLIDTLLISKLFNPDRDGHSLDSWGQRLGLAKIEFNDWSQLSEEMIVYCKRDVELNYKVYKALMEEAGNWDWKSACELEHQVAKIIQKQEEHGVLFNKALAEECLDDLTGKLIELEERIEPLLPQREIPKSQLKTPPKNRFKKDGSPSALAIKYFGEYLKQSGDEWIVEYPSGAITELSLATTPLQTREPMKLANQADIKEWLMSMGWEPTIWNVRKDRDGKPKKTSPKLADAGKNICPNLLKLGKRVEFVDDIVLWLSYRNRRNVIMSGNGTGWLCNDRLCRDSRLSASADTIGTNTGRFAHRVVANIPRVSSTYGRQMRSLFTVPNDHYMVGWDASALEARIEAHYTYKYDDGAYAFELLQGDVHSTNAASFGCDRDTAKTVKYAVMYGARPPKLAATLGCPLARGEEIFNTFWETNISLSDLKEALITYWKGHGSQYIKGLDGRKVMTRSEHSLINTLFQSGGIICMKRAMVLWDQWIKELDIPAAQVIHYHDEAQAEVHKSDIIFKRFSSEEEAKDFKDDKIWSGIINKDGKIYRGYSRAGELGVLSIRKAGEELGLKVPLDAEYKIGKTWADTH